MNQSEKFKLRVGQYQLLENVTVTDSQVNKLLILALG